MSTHTTYLPPLPRIAAARPYPSERTTTLITATIVLLAGISALAWAFRLDPTDNQLFVAAAATWTVLAPAFTLTVLRSVHHRR